MQEVLRRTENLQRLVQETNGLQTHAISIPNLQIESGLGSILVQCIANEFALDRSGISNERECQQHSDIVKSRIREAMIDALSCRGKAEIDVRTANIKLPEHRQQAYTRVILRSFQYTTLYDREQNVKNAHRKTFRWILSGTANQEHTYDSFQDWLQSSEQVYWITGKPGSGKTTLMKFINSTLQTDINSMFRDERWDRQSFITASFYFWALGPEIQASKEGLYRTLLYQLLSQRPDTIPQVCPERWEMICLFGELPKTFGKGELRELLHSTLKILTSKDKVCLFIDGLDEFAGDCDDLVGDFKQLVEACPVKLCVASRPWEVFRDALQDKPRLQMEHLTHDDIENYITCRLHDDTNFDRFKRLEPHFASITITEIVEKAQGVFLWVELVVSSLLVGLRSGDRISDLKRRLDSLPQDLEGLFERIIGDLELQYKEQAAQYLRLMDACQDLPSAILFSLADEDPEFSVKLQLNTFDKDSVDERVETIRRRLNTRLKGLLEIVKHRRCAHGIPDAILRKDECLDGETNRAYEQDHMSHSPEATVQSRQYAQYLLRTLPFELESVYEGDSNSSRYDTELSDEEPGFAGSYRHHSDDCDPSFQYASSYHVQYLHRTVKDYFNKPIAKKMLTDPRLRPFDPHLKLCAGYLAFFKSCHSIGIKHLRGNHVSVSRGWEKSRTIFRCVESASLVSECNEFSMIRILEDLERSIESSFTTDHPFKVEADWIRPLRLSRQGLNAQMTIWAAHFEIYEGSFLSLAMKAGVVGYVKRQVLKHKDDQSAEKSKQSRHAMLSGHFTTLRNILRTKSREPSLLDILLRDSVMSIQPNAEMVRVLLWQGAIPNIVFRDLHNSQGLGLEYTAWIAMLSLAIGVFSHKSWDPHNKPEWVKVAQFMVARGTLVNKKTVHKAVELLRFWRFTVNPVITEAEDHDRHDENELERILEMGLKRAIFHEDMSQPLAASSWEVQCPTIDEGLVGWGRGFRPSF